MIVYVPVFFFLQNGFSLTLAPQRLISFFFSFPKQNDHVREGCARTSKTGIQPVFSTRFLAHITYAKKPCKLWSFETGRNGFYSKNCQSNILCDYVSFLCDMASNPTLVLFAWTNNHLRQTVTRCNLNDMKETSRRKFRILNSNINTERVKLVPFWNVNDHFLHFPL